MSVNDLEQEQHIHSEWRMWIIGVACDRTVTVGYTTVREISLTFGC